jgi:hypothetical protein
MPSAAQQQDANKLALIAAKGNEWKQRKFVKFLIEHADDLLWTSRDELYVFCGEHYTPSRDRFEQVLTDVYRARGAALHGGRRYGPSVGVGTSTMVPVDSMIEILTKELRVPPVTWFERVVNLALCTYLRRSVDPKKPG